MANNPKTKYSLYSQETEKRDPNFNVGNARKQKNHIGSFGHSENNDNSPKIFETAEIQNIKGQKISLKSGKKPPLPHQQD